MDNSLTSFQVFFQMYATYSMRPNLISPLKIAAHLLPSPLIPDPPLCNSVLVLYPSLITGYYTFICLLCSLLISCLLPLKSNKLYTGRVFCLFCSLISLRADNCGCHLDDQYIFGELNKLYIYKTIKFGIKQKWTIFLI